MRLLSEKPRALTYSTQVQVQWSDLFSAVRSSWGEMSTGGYQGPTADFAPTGFGSDSPENSSRNGATGSNIANPPLFAADYKRCILHVYTHYLVPKRPADVAV